MTKTPKKSNTTSSARNRHRYRGALARPLATNERPENKLPALYKELGVSSAQQAIIELAKRHVPGFQSASNAAGRKRLLTTAYEDILIDYVQFNQAYNEAHGLPKKSLLTIVTQLSRTKTQDDEEASPNPFYGLSPHTLQTIYKRRDERERTFDRKTEAALDWITKSFAESSKKLG